MTEKYISVTTRHTVSICVTCHVCALLSRKPVLEEGAQVLVSLALS